MNDDTLAGAPRRLRPVARRIPSDWSRPGELSLYDPRTTLQSHERERSTAMESLTRFRGEPILDEATGLPFAGPGIDGTTVLCGHADCDASLAYISGRSPFDIARDYWERTCYTNEDYYQGGDEVWKRSFNRPWSTSSYDPNLNVRPPVDDPADDEILDLTHVRRSADPDATHYIPLPAVVECEKCHGRSVLDPRVLWIFDGIVLPRTS